MIAFGGIPSSLGCGIVGSWGCRVEGLSRRGSWGENGNGHGLNCGYTRGSVKVPTALATANIAPFVLPANWCFA